MGTPALTALSPALPLPEHPACLVPLDAWPEPGQGEQHPSCSSATLRILANMPSRTIGRCRPSFPRLGSPSRELLCLPHPPPALLSLAGRSRGALISQYYNRTARLRRQSSRPPLQQLSCAARPSLRQYDLETDPARATLAGEGPLGSAGRCPQAGFRMGTACPGQPRATEPLVPPDKQSLLVKELLSLSPSQRRHMLLIMPLSLAEKRALR